MGGILITERRRFTADHRHSLPDFCEPRHGHDWEAEATVEEEGHALLGPLLDAWAMDMDHSLLNEKEMLAGRNPTAEAVAECLFLRLEESGLRPVAVRIREKQRCWAACLRGRPTRFARPADNGADPAPGPSSPADGSNAL